MKPRLPVLLLVVLFGIPATGQMLSAGMRTDGLYAYAWKGKRFHAGSHKNCDSITSPDVFFTFLPIFFFYGDNTIVQASDDYFDLEKDGSLTPDYFHRREARLTTALDNKVKQKAMARFGVYRSDGDTLTAKLRYWEYSWGKYPVYYHFVRQGPDTLWLTEVDCSFCVYCSAPAGKMPVVKFTPPVLFTFYPFPARPDSSWAGFDKGRWARNW